MATVLSPTSLLTNSSKPRQIPQRQAVLPPPQPPQLKTGVRSGRLNLDTFSPVNQNGSFEFDRVLKSGDLKLRTRKTKTWRQVHLVLRPNLISVYRGKDESQLRHLITLSDLTAVAHSKNPKYKGKHVFGLYSPSRNYHLEAETGKGAQEWVELIRREARIEEEECMVVGSFAGHAPQDEGHAGSTLSAEQRRRTEEARLASSSPEPFDFPSYSSRTRDGIRVPEIKHHNVQNLEYSGTELASYSDFSDTVGPHAGISGASSLSIARQDGQGALDALAAVTPGHSQVASSAPQKATHSEAPALGQGDERVVWHGFLLCLRSKGGVRQWKRLWVVLRPKNLAFYKSEEEYAARLLIPLSNIISAVEIDPISRSKRYCMQIITEEKTYRFCAPGEEALDKWLGSLKSQLARRKDISRKRVASGPVP